MVLERLFDREGTEIPSHTLEYDLRNHGIYSFDDRKIEAIFVVLNDFFKRAGLIAEHDGDGLYFRNREEFEAAAEQEVGNVCSRCHDEEDHLSDRVLEAYNDGSEYGRKAGYREGYEAGLEAGYVMPE